MPSPVALSTWPRSIAPYPPRVLGAGPSGKVRGCPCAALDMIAMFRHLLATAMDCRLPAGMCPDRNLLTALAPIRDSACQTLEKA